MNSTITLFTVVYPGCEPYLPRFFQSVREQDSDSFSVMILNDGLKNLDRFTTDLSKPVEKIPVSGSIADVRRQGIQLLMKSSYDKIIFADADDYFSPDRMRLAAEALDDCDIFVNDLSTVTDSGELILEHYLSKRVGDTFEINTEFILNKNLIGLGNTAVRRSQLRDLRIPSDTIAVDWMLFTDMLLRGASAIFKREPVSFYRQHQENTAGLRQPTVEKIRHSLNVQIQNASFFAGKSAPHKVRHKKLLKLQTYFADNSQHIHNYKHALEHQLPEFPLWWEEIVTLDQLSL